MPYHAVVDQFPIPVPLDPWAAAIFVAVFAAAALLTARRAAYGLAALVMLEPFAFARVVGSTAVTLPKVALLGVLLGLTVYTGCTARLRDRPLPLLLGGFGAYAAAMAVSSLVAAHPGAAIHETLKVVEYAVVLATAYLCYRIDADAGIVLNAVAVAAIVVSLTALAQEALGAPSGLCVGSATIPRIAGVLEGPNQLAGYLEVSLATLGAWALLRRTPLVAFAMGVASCTLVLTFSRAGVAGLVAIGAILVYAGGRPAWRAMIPGFVGLAAGAIGASGWALVTHTANALRLSFDESICAGGVGSRSDLWLAAWHMFAAHPLLGIGAGNFESALPQYGVLGVRTHANSWYLQSLAEGGVVLFAATLALVIVAVTSFARGLRDASPWIVAAFAATIALCLHQIADYLVFYPKVGAPWCILLGIGAAAVAARNVRERAAGA